MNPDAKAGKRRRIFAAAAAVFSQKGFHQARMDEIAARAGVAKGTLYYNFSSKSKLFSATVTEGIEQIIAKIRENLRSDLPFMVHFHKLIECNVDLYLQYSDLARIVFNEVSNGIDDAVRDDIERMRRRYVDFVSDQLRDGVEKGYLRPVNRHLAAVAVVGMLDSLCSLHLRDAGVADREEIVALIFDMLRSGLTLPARSEDAGPPSSDR